METYKKQLSQDVVLQRFVGIDASIFMPSKWAPSGGFPGFQWEGKKVNLQEIISLYNFSSPLFSWGGLKCSGHYVFSNVDKLLQKVISTLSSFLDPSCRLCCKIGSWMVYMYEKHTRNWG